MGRILTQLVRLVKETARILRSRAVVLH
jgi:hypothetical protein